VNPGETTVAVQRYLSDLGRVQGDASAEPIIRELLARSADRLQVLGARMLHGGFPRLARPPLNLQSEDMLGAVAERMMKALREARPKDVRQFFALANQHLRWELMDLARRLDAQPRAVELQDALVPAHDTTVSGPGPDALRMLEAIERLPDEEREAFSLVRIQELSQTEAADVLGVATKTVQRRLTRALILLTEELGDLAPAP
jgi:RNA polymerase sigma-70 factor (ECF subfamily)